MLLQAVQPNQGRFAASLGAQGSAAIFKYTLLTTKASATGTICHTSQCSTGLPQLVLPTKRMLSEQHCQLAYICALTHSMFDFSNSRCVASRLCSHMLHLLQLCSILCSCSASVLTPETLQVYCLKSIRAIEAGDKIDPRFENYEPTDPEMKALLARDPGAHKHPYKSAVEDALIITMKGISAAMQNTG